MKVTIGSRGSKLALWQAQFVRAELERTTPGLEVTIRIIKTTGDKISETALGTFSGTGKGLFVKEIEEALLAREVDLAVHSLKDVPTELSPEFTLSAIMERADVRDALVTGNGESDWRILPERARLGTSSLRRTVQLRALRSDFEIEVIRGNVDTRLRKQKEQNLAGVILAAAGLKRLGLETQISYLFPPGEMVPAIGQGALAIETRAEDAPITDLTTRLEHPPTRTCVEAERAFLKRMGGGCQVPMGAHGWLEEDRAHFTALVASPTRAEILRESVSGPAGNLTEMALTCSERLLARGADRILKELEML